MWRKSEWEESGYQRVQLSMVGTGGGVDALGKWICGRHALAEGICNPYLMGSVDGVTMRHSRCMVESVVSTNGSRSQTCLHISRLKYNDWTALELQGGTVSAVYSNI